MPEENKQSNPRNHPSTQPLIPMPEFTEKQTGPEVPISRPLSPEEEAEILASGMEMIVGEMANIIATSDAHPDDKNAMKQEITTFAIGARQDFLKNTQRPQPRRIQAGPNQQPPQNNPAFLQAMPVPTQQIQQATQEAHIEDPNQMLLPFKQTDLDSISEDVDSLFSEVKRLRKELSDMKAEMKVYLEDNKEMLKEILTKQNFGA